VSKSFLLSTARSNDEDLSKPPRKPQSEESEDFSSGDNIADDLDEDGPKQMKTAPKKSQVRK